MTFRLLEGERKSECNEVRCLQKLLLFLSLNRPIGSCAGSSGVGSLVAVRGAT